MFTFNLTDGIQIGWGWVLVVQGVGFLTTFAHLIVTTELEPDNELFVGYGLLSFFSWPCMVFAWFILIPFFTTTGKLIRAVAKQLRLL